MDPPWGNHKYEVLVFPSPSQKNDEEYEKSDKQDIIKAQVGWESSTNQPLEDRAYWVKSYTDYIESTGVYIGYNTDRKPL